MGEEFVEFPQKCQARTSKISMTFYEQRDSTNSGFGVLVFESHDIIEILTVAYFGFYMH